MNMSNKLNLPQKLIPYRDRIEATIKPHVKIHLVPQQTQLWDSKIGGLPYFPQAKADDYPCNSEGKPLQFLAQINFSQIPHLSDFPSQGILQFYLDNDDCYGLDFDHPLEQNHFRVIYFPEIVEHKDHLVTDFSFIPNEDNYLHPVQGEFAFNFTLTQSSMSVSDCHFPSIFGEDEDQSMELMGDYENWLNEHFGYSQTAHQIGGYPDFTQEDPRYSAPPSENWQALQ